MIFITSKLLQKHFVKLTSYQVQALLVILTFCNIVWSKIFVLTVFKYHPIIPWHEKHIIVLYISFFRRYRYYFCYLPISILHGLVSCAGFFSTLSKGKNYKSRRWKLLIKGFGFGSENTLSLTQALSSSLRPVPSGYPHDYI